MLLSFLKRRISGAETQITSISADVKDKLVIIYDDMIRTGGSWNPSCDGLQKCWSKRYCSHHNTWFIYSECNTKTERKQNN